MRRIEYTTRFRRDYKREMKGQYRKVIEQDFSALLRLLRSDSVMPPRFEDHPLTGNWSDHRDCHLRPDLVLIYRKPDTDTLQLVRLGTHSELDI